MARWINDGLLDVGSAIKKAVEQTKNNVQEQANQQKINAQNLISSTFDQIDDGFDSIKSKLSMISNILSEDISIDGVGFRTKEITEIKEQIDIINK